MAGGTVRISLKRIAMLFPDGSPHRVYLHGMWQRSRKRNPSIGLHNETDPRRAFALARVLVGGYIEDVRCLTCSRHDWFWSPERVAAVARSAPLEDVEAVRTPFPW